LTAEVLAQRFLNPAALASRVRFENPELVLQQTIRDMRDRVPDLNNSVAQVMATERLLAKNHENLSTQVVDLDSKVVEGTLRPSSDTKTHAALYRAFGGIGGIVHTHSTYATAWAQARTPIPLYGTTHADHLAEDVPCTELMTAEAVERDYEAETGTQIIDCFRGRDPQQTPMVLVAGHGPFAWGKTAEKAVYHAVVLEELAKIASITRSLDPRAARLPDYLVNKHFQRKHGKSAYYGQ